MAVADGATGVLVGLGDESSLVAGSESVGDATSLVIVGRFSDTDESFIFLVFSRRLVIIEFSRFSSVSGTTEPKREETICIAVCSFMVSLDRTPLTDRDWETLKR